MARDRWKQRLAARDHYLRNTEEMKKRAGDARKKQVERLRQAVRRAKNVPCADCKESHPHYVMDFDHVRGKKRGDIAVMCQSGISLRTLFEEIAKCEIVCSNCHRSRTFNRRQAESPERHAREDELALF